MMTVIISILVITANIIFVTPSILELIATYIANQNIKRYGTWWGELHGWKEEFVKKYKF